MSKRWRSKCRTAPRWSSVLSTAMPEFNAAADTESFVLVPLAPFWVLLLGILLGGVVLLAALNWFFPGIAGKHQFPYAIHSPLVADYSGGRPVSFVSVSIDTIAKMFFGDSEGGLQSQQVLVDQLKTPVPSVTPHRLLNRFGLPAFFNNPLT